MSRTLALLALIAVACALRIHNLQHDLQHIPNEHNVALPDMHAPTSAPVDYDQVRNQYLSKIPPGPTVDGGKARELQAFLGTPMGKVIIDYFQSLASSKFNYYGLNDDNFRLWFAIKMLAKNDSNMYLRSLAADKNLFVEFVKKAYNIG